MENYQVRRCFGKELLQITKTETNSDEIKTMCTETDKNK